MNHIKIKRITLNRDKSEAWIVFEDVVSNYVGTLHTKHQDLIQSLLDNNFTDLIFKEEDKK